MALEAFWDLFRQRAVTLGMDTHTDSSDWLFFRLSRFSATALAQRKLYRFHDTSSYIALVKGAVPDLLEKAELYREEAGAALYADCLLASADMLGVAYEVELLRLINVAAASATYGSSFLPVGKKPIIKSKINEYQKRLTQHLNALPRDRTEDLDTNLSTIQSVLRIAS